MLTLPSAWKRGLSLAAAVLLTACAAPTPAPIVAPAHPQPAPVKLKVGLALGGGAAKGFAHIGVIKVLEAAGITPEIVTGTSAGSVVGSLYAAGNNGFALQKKALDLDENSLADLTLSTSGFIKGEKLAAYVNREVGNRPIEKLPRTFAAVATDLDSGQAKVFTSGNTGQAVRASASIPNVFQPVNIAGRRYVDGGLVAPVPVAAARQLGADFVIAVDIGAKPIAKAGGGFFSMLDQSLNIMNLAALAQELKQADVVIRPQVQQFGSLGFDERNRAILEGERAAQQVLPQIKALMTQKALSLGKVR
jgi:NTE family protein